MIGFTGSGGNMKTMHPRIWNIFAAALLMASFFAGSIGQPAIGQANNPGFVDASLLQKAGGYAQVIVTAGSPAEAMRAVRQAGGQVSSELWLIQAVSASVPNQNIQQLAGQPGVRSVVADRQAVQPAAGLAVEGGGHGFGKPDQRRKMGQVHLDAPQIVAAASLPNGGFLSIAENGKVVVINPDGSERARTSLGINGFKNPLTLAADNTIYAVSENNRIFAIAPDGQVRWTFNAPNKFFGGAVVGQDGSVIAVDERQVIYALDPNSGLLRWNLNLSLVVSATVRTSPTVGPDGTIYVVNTRDPGDLFAVAGNGTLKWRYTGMRTRRFDYAPLVSANAIFTASIEQLIYAVNLDGSARYTFATESKIFARPVVDSQENLYAAAEHHLLGWTAPGICASATQSAARTSKPRPSFRWMARRCM